jgi:hypothetical protein
MEKVRSAFSNLDSAAMVTFSWTWCLGMVGRYGAMGRRHLGRGGGKASQNGTGRQRGVGVGVFGQNTSLCQVLVLIFRSHLERRRGQAA